MKNQPQAEEFHSGLAPEQSAECEVPQTPAKPVKDNSAQHPDPGGKPEPVNKLSAEEQLALYEKDLKENDWGHQPC